MHNFKELIIWQKGIKLASDVYEVCSGFPKEELYGISSQIKRCAVSVASNIAEGAGRNSEKEFLHFLTISYGSLYELETQLIIAQNINLISSENMESIVVQITELQKMIYKFQQKLKEKQIQKTI
jgi:four helix bundle protein